jgi:hypothetical protein
MWKGGKQEMEKLINYVKEIGFFDGQYLVCSMFSLETQRKIIWK